MKKVFSLVLKFIGVVAALLIAVVIFFSLAARLRETKTRQEAAPSNGHFVQAGDAEIFYQEMGPAQAETILFIHGSGAWSGLLGQTESRLAALGYHRVAIDVPPFGFSEKPAGEEYGNAAQAKRIIAVLDALHIQRAVLFVHSVGGGAAMEAALTIPDRIDALVLLDIGGLNFGAAQAAPNSGPTVASVILSTPALRDPLLAATITNPLMTRTLITKMVLDPHSLSEKDVQILQQPLFRRNATDTVGGWLHYLFSTAQPSLTSEAKNYARLTMPALIIWGDHDTIIPLSQGQYLHSLLKNSELDVLPGVNHVPYLEAPDAVIERIKNFLQQNSL